MKHALVVGATGVIGGAIARHLAGLKDARVCCVSRGGAAPEGATGLSIDLLDERAVAAACRTMPLVTHLYFAGYQARPSRLEEVAPNLAMLRHAIDLAQAGGALQRTVLVTGGKYYGLQWGAIRTPARESDPRHLGPNFYYAQHDHLVERAALGGWSWSHLIPPYVTGYSDRAPMNLVMAIAVLAVLSREAGLSLRFPGPAASWNALHHLADARLIAEAAAWAGSSEAAANQIFNIANGDPGRWRHSWGRIAAHFGLAEGEPLAIPLTQVAAEQAGVWERLARKAQLRQHDIHQLVDWQWADYMFKTAFSNDVLFALGKIRRAGFAACIDNEAALCGRFDELREQRFIP
ncbi:SDR family oxidoreductase [Xenophilus arseniciresistens]|uniref:SDR family oxidoreductase n=1 Tax=Xenophilus arseniciresistens TaxID=1283306 RepID=A0AAE3T208_9BURK|nr:SDR family oxidoreductase [Xenophilus arseniciresistens]MDA7419195.1 SDR family oxidoreductase [Xenophilus arseniciresistens]